MVNPYDKAHELARALQESEPFRHVRDVRAKIRQDADAERMLNDFRKRQREWQAKLLGGESSEDEAKQIEKLYDVVTLHPLIRELFEAERRAMVLMDDVYRIVGEPLRRLGEE